MRRLGVCIALAVSGLLLTAGVGAASAAQSESGSQSSGTSCTWHIGTLGPLSGTFASLGLGYEHGVQYAVDSINAQHKLACKLAVSSQDTAGDPTQDAILTRKLIDENPGVLSVLPFFSSDTLAAGPKFNAAGIPFIAVNSADNLVDQGWTYFHRLAANNSAEATVDALYIDDVLHAKRVAILDDNSDYGKGVAETLITKLHAAHVGPIVLSTTSSDYSGQVDQIRAANVDAIYFAGFAAQGGPLVKQLRLGGVNAPFVGADGLYDPTFGQLAGSAASGTTVSCSCSDPRHLPAAGAFVKGMQARYGKSAPGAYAADLYDGVEAIATALRGAPAKSSVSALRKRINHWFSTTKGYHGITKTYRWARNGELITNPLMSMFFYRWSSNGWVSIGRASQVIHS